MAEINFWARLSNLWMGFVSLWVSDVEKKHPEIAYENAINGMITKYTKLKSATAAIIRRRDDVAARLQTERTALAEVTADLNTALETNQDDLAMVLLQKKNAIEAELQGLKTEMDQALADADDAKASLVAVQGEVKKLKAEKDRMVAKLQSAQARIQVQAQIDGLSVDAEVKALDNVREHIKNTVAEANLGKELRQSDLDVRLASLRQQTGAVTARVQLEELKKARAQAAQQAQGNKTM
jgi:phage shock protein A